MQRSPTGSTTPTEPPLQSPKPESENRLRAGSVRCASSAAREKEGLLKYPRSIQNVWDRKQLMRPANTCQGAEAGSIHYAGTEGERFKPGDEVHVSPCAPRTIRCGGCKRLHWERAKALFLERETRALRRRRRGGKSRQGAAAAELPVRRADSRSPRREPAAAQQSRSLSPGRRASNAGRSRALAARLGVGRFSPASRRVGRRRSGSHESAAGKEGRCGRRAEETQHAVRNNTGSREGHLRGGQRAQNSANH